MTTAVCSASPGTRHGSALILIMAILVLVSVLAFGMLAFVSDQRGWARTKHEDALIRQGLLSGRAHAQRVLEKAYLAALAVPGTVADDAVTTLALPASPTAQQTNAYAWRSEFASQPAPSALGWPAPGDTTYTTEALRQTRRQTLVAGTWGENNAYDLWRFEAGLASPLVRPDPASPHGQEDGYCSHDGTGRWFTVAWLDRELRPVTQAKASLQLRYAVAAIDLSGSLLGNKARYKHLVPSGTTAALGASYLRGANERSASVGAVVVGDRYAATAATRDDVPVSGIPCPVTDVALGRVKDAVADAHGYDRIHYNSWRPIPVDHTFSAHMLITVGCGLDDSTPRTLADGTTVVGVWTDPNDGRKYEIRQRTGGSLPDAWRSQGYQSVTLAYWQFSRRFGDFLPFAQNPHPSPLATAGDAWKTLWTKDASTPPAADTTTQTTAAKTPPPPKVYNRHPAALLVALQGDTSNDPLGTHKFADDPYDYNLDQNARRLGDIWNQVDRPNWWALQQGLRLHRIASDGAATAAGLPNLPSQADGQGQCWSPFGSPIGRFNGRATGDRLKNDWEMRYQWTPDANTAARQVLLDVLRLAIPAKEVGGGVWHSVESLAAADRDAYAAYIRGIADQIIAGRPYLSNATLAAGPLTWCADAATQRMLQSCIHGGAPAGLEPNDLGTLGAGNYAGCGPRAEFAVVEWNTSATPYVVIEGRHVKRFWSGVGVIDRPDAAYRLRGWRVGGGAASSPDLWVQTSIAAVGQVGAEYVSGAVGSWSPDASGTRTRIWLVPGSETQIRTADDRVLVPYPGLSLTIGVSRWFRVALRAELRDLDAPAASRDLSMDLVLHLDPDASGNATGTTGLWDGDVPYCDLENALQYRTKANGSVVW